MNGECNEADWEVLGRCNTCGHVPDPNYQVEVEVGIYASFDFVVLDLLSQTAFT
jgi:hypothetical protein